MEFYCEKIQCILFGPPPRYGEIVNPQRVAGRAVDGAEAEVGEVREVSVREFQLIIVLLEFTGHSTPFRVFDSVHAFLTVEWAAVYHPIRAELHKTNATTQGTYRRLGFSDNYHTGSQVCCPCIELQ